MPLNLATNDGDFTPFIKYNAKAGRWYIRVDGVEGDVEVTNPVLAFDFDNIRTGWIYYVEGVGPEKVWDPSPTVMATKPAGGKPFKRGFEVVVWGSGNVGVREFSSTAGSAISAIMEIYAIYEAGREANAGKVPVFSCAGVKPITGKHGTNYAPIFKLHSWRLRATIPFDGNAPTNQPQQTTGPLPDPAIVAILTTASKSGLTALQQAFQMLTRPQKQSVQGILPRLKADALARDTQGDANEDDWQGGPEPTYDDPEPTF